MGRREMVEAERRKAQGPSSSERVGRARAEYPD